MTEILTESFCERCGTRYTFESARPKLRLKGMKTVSRGLKNFVLSDGTSMDEAMAAARSETEREVTAYQLDAFHKTFNFCMQCRQYTCPNCWNEVEARCLTCAPHLGHEVMPAPFPDLPATPRVVMDGSAGMNGSDADFDFDVAARLNALTMSTAPEPLTAAGPIVASSVATPSADAVVAPTPEIAAEVRPAPPTDPHRAAELAALASAAAVIEEAATDEALASDKGTSAGTSNGRFSPFRLGQDIDAELEAYERNQAALAAAAIVVTPDDAAVAPEAVESAVVEAEPVVEPAAAAAEIVAPPAVAEPIAEPEAVAEPIAAAAPKVVAEPVSVTEPEIIAEPVAPPAAAAIVAAPEAAPAAVEPEVAPAAAAIVAEPAVAEPVVAPTPVVQDVVAQPTWRMVAPDDTDATTPPAIPDLPAAATAADPSGEPQWPTRPAWLGGTPAAGLPFLGRPAAPQGGLEALWAESNREVADPRLANKPAGGVQPCLSCGLSLSATAKFCRRCGTPQAT